MAFKERKHLKVSHFGLKTFIASKYWREKQQQKNVNFSALLWWTFHSAALTPRVVNVVQLPLFWRVSSVFAQGQLSRNHMGRGAHVSPCWHKAHIMLHSSVPPRISCYIFLILWQSWQVVPFFFPPPLAPISFYGLLSSFFVFPLMEAAVLPHLHPEVRRIKLHLHFFSPLLRGCKFMIALLRELRPRRRSRNSEAQSRLSEVVGGWFRTACPRLCPLVFLAWL